MLTAIGWSKEVTLLEEPGKVHTRLYCGISQYRGEAHVAPGRNAAPSERNKALRVLDYLSAQIFWMLVHKSRHIHL